MYSPLVPQLLQLYDQPKFFGGVRVRISFPVKYMGAVPVDARFVLYVYEGSILPWHGRLITSYEKVEHFEPYEEREIFFEHRTVSTGEGRRDLGLEVFKDTLKLYSGEWDDPYFVTTVPEQMTGWVMMMVPLGLAGMVIMMVEEVM